MLPLAGRPPNPPPPKPLANVEQVPLTGAEIATLVAVTTPMELVEPCTVTHEPTERSLEAAIARPDTVVEEVMGTVTDFVAVDEVEVMAFRVSDVADTDTTLPT